MTEALLMILVGMVVKVLVPMPWFDDPVRKAYAWVYSKVTG